MKIQKVAKLEKMFRDRMGQKLLPADAVKKLQATTQHNEYLIDLGKHEERGIYRIDILA